VPRFVRGLAWVLMWMRMESWWKRDCTQPLQVDHQLALRICPITSFDHFPDFNISTSQHHLTSINLQAVTAPDHATDSTINGGMAARTLVSPALHGLRTGPQHNLNVHSVLRQHVRRIVPRGLVGCESDNRGLCTMEPVAYSRLWELDSRAC